MLPGKIQGLIVREMYRLSGPNIIIFIPLLVLGIIVAALTPHYFIQSRIISLTSLLIGEIGLSFIPVIALFPRATFIQAIVLAVIYLLTTLVTCLAAWGINSLGWPGEYSFLIKDDEFQINIFALFVSNIFSFILLITNYKLTYDEELTKKNKQAIKDRKKGLFSNINKSKLNRPHFEEAIKSTSESTEAFKTPRTKSLDKDLDEDFWKPFEFEPEGDKTAKNLPEESSGKLFAEEIEIKDIKKESEFFDDDESAKKFNDTPAYQTIEKPKPIQISPFPPSNIKDELAEIFEQYSSLDAVKKITSSKSEKPYKRKTERESKKPYSLSESQISVKVEGEDIHEASFRQISDAEKIEEIKETLKRELEQEIKSKPPAPNEPKENIIESIKSIKEELIESLKIEIKKEFSEIEPAAVSNEEREILKQRLKEVNNTDQVLGSVYLQYNGNVLSENWNEKPELFDSENVPQKITQLFNQFNKQINKTKQGSLLHILLESKNGTLVMVNEEDKLLAVQTKGTGEVYMGQLLRKLSEVKEL
ncbi:MAG: hypothetical protein A3I68_08680 [Candidatus Melainabacteria bacterium RIFCSPLOWO2_02_FULL_35_15]|nr:MAG: hypothetical protein A3F80_06850 [Candidatus Melainabacteria bacterium RIFCSPLOWO2_12_FULL_35_11]OGI14042.1 MAG: hypothetical protein A3I68_08680 [Candidatus Melainabacteria bacterium RIFCSPLOWO2_02_FULL_35_15]